MSVFCHSLKLLLINFPSLRRCIKKYFQQFLNTPRVYKHFHFSHFTNQTKKKHLKLQQKKSLIAATLKTTVEK